MMLEIRPCWISPRSSALHIMSVSSAYCQLESHLWLYLFSQSLFQVSSLGLCNFTPQRHSSYILVFRKLATFLVLLSTNRCRKSVTAVTRYLDPCIALFLARYYRRCLFLFSSKFFKVKALIIIHPPFLRCVSFLWYYCTVVAPSPFKEHSFLIWAMLHFNYVWKYKTDFTNDVWGSTEWKLSHE